MPNELIRMKTQMMIDAVNDDITNRPLTTEGICQCREAMKAHMAMMEQKMGSPPIPPMAGPTTIEMETIQAMAKIGLGPLATTKPAKTPKAKGK